MNGQDVTVEKLNEYANDLLKMLVKDGASLEEVNLKLALENVARAMVDLTNNQLHEKSDSLVSLQTTLSKMKIANNCFSIPTNSN
ncbi:hypothetical protein [Sutcliffiella deserti]|uniref:hypothetical protein n=1 Tax=Sutcliffiella deserti TaxID=2875501 RepID=UPI001CC1B493|nr:hypothetical protein [Sutcliffiella deserti]